MKVLEIEKNYTELRPCVVAGEEKDCFTVWLMIGSQQFCLSEVYFLDEAKWMQRRLATALAKFKNKRCPLPDKEEADERK